MKAACIQMDIRHCKKQTNIDHTLSMSGKAISEGAELIVLPEVFSTDSVMTTLKRTQSAHHIRQ
jgi:predicted amidohydrolase